MAEEGCPIESNIKSTDDGGNNNNDNNWDDDANYNDDDEFADADDDLFDDEDGDALMADDDNDWGSVHSSADGQESIPIVIKHAKPMIGVNDMNPYAEGNEVAVANGAKPQIEDGDPKQKCWLCDICNAVNNMLDSMKKYNYRCCVCSYAYHPNVAIIYSNDWDGVQNENNEQESIYTVWNCPFCTLKNDVNWSKCDGCEQHKPPSDQVEISYTYIKPKKLNGPPSDENNKKNQKKQNKKNNNNGWQDYDPNQWNQNKQKKEIKKVERKPRIQNIGIAKNYDEYPSKSVMNENCEDRLVNIFGRPYRNKLLGKHKKNKWTIDCGLSHSRIEWSSYSNDAKHFVSEECVGRGFAINQKSGWIATMSINYLWVFEPIGASSFKLRARHEFGMEQKLKGEDVQNSRVRFVNDYIYVWSFARSRVYSFKLSFNSLILIDVIKDKYFKDSQTMDIAVTNNLLILLFDRWCGVYKLYPKFEWYHAVAFATKAVNCFSFELNDYDDTYDRTPISHEPFFDEEEEEKGITSNIKNVWNSTKISRSKRKKNKNKKLDENENKNDDFYRSSNRNYMFINTENQLIGIHPVNPSFDFLHIARDAKHGKTKFCISKNYGLFYLSNEGNIIYQSSCMEYKNSTKIFELNSNDKMFSSKFYAIEQYHDLVLTQGIQKFSNIGFDEGFGISGRLLLYCQTKKSQFIMHQMFNYDELKIFYNELNKINYILMPGMDRKPFNLIIYVFEMLYGNDLIETLLQSPFFNTSLLRLKQQQENELKKIQKQQQEQQKQKREKQKQQQEIKQHDFLMIHEGPNNSDDMEIEYEPEGAM